MKFGPLVKEDYEQNCCICGNPTRFSHVNPSGAHVPCCKNCYYSLKDHIEEESSRNEDVSDPSYTKLGCYSVIAIVVIILLAFARSSC